MSIACARKDAEQIGGASREARARPEGERGSGDELQELAHTFRWTVDRVASLVREVEEAHQRVLQAEKERKEFYREVIRAVTQGKFELEESGSVPQVGEPVAELPVHNGDEYAAARSAILETAEAAGMAPERVDDLLIAAGEAISNALKHAGGGTCALYRAPDSIVVRISDTGGGIRSLDLPNMILKSGFSTKVSLGMGYTLMLKLTDHVWLSTGPEGTVVQLEKKIQPPPPSESPILEAMARVGPQGSGFERNHG